MGATRIQQTLSSTGVYTAYFDISSDIEAPYIVWRGSGQINFEADDTFYYNMGNTYEVDYYFLEKDEDLESVIEDTLIAAGYLYDKSADMRDEDTGELLIIYNVRAGAAIYEEDEED